MSLPPDGHFSSPYADRYAWFSNPAGTRVRGGGSLRVHLPAAFPAQFVSTRAAVQRLSRRAAASSRDDGLLRFVRLEPWPVESFGFRAVRIREESHAFLIFKRHPVCGVLWPTLRKAGRLQDQYFHPDSKTPSFSAIHAAQAFIIIEGCVVIYQELADDRRYRGRHSTTCAAATCRNRYGPS